MLCLQFLSNILIFNFSFPLFHTHSWILSHCFQLEPWRTAPSPPPSPTTFAGKILFFFFFLFCLVAFFTDALIHPPLKSSRASNSRAVLLPHLLLLRGQGQRGCGLLLHHFLKREKMKRKLLLLPPPLILLSISFNHDLPQLASSPPSLQPILLGCYSFSATNLNWVLRTLSLSNFLYIINKEIVPTIPGLVISSASCGWCAEDIKCFCEAVHPSCVCSEHSPMFLLQLSPMSDPAKEPHGLRKKLKGLLMLGKTTLYPATVSADICLVSQSNNTSAPARSLQTKKS